MIDKFNRSEFSVYFDNLASDSTSNVYVKTDGSSTITADMDFNSNKIINLAEPTNSHDAATKNYVDTHSTGGWNLSWNCRLGFEFSQSDQLERTDQSSRRRHQKLRRRQLEHERQNGRVEHHHGRLGFKFPQIDQRLTDPTALKDAATKSYVDTKVAYNNISYADINMTSHKLTNLAEPTSSSDSATKNYVDTHVGWSSVEQRTWI
jgi:hypothetical protein